MASTSANKPPDYNPDNYTWSAYKKEVLVWATWTKLEDTKKGPALWSSLTGKAKEAVQDMELDEIKAADGLEKILTKLDDVFKTDINQAAYIAYRDFETFSRPSEMSLQDFIVKFEALNLKISKLDMKLPDGVLAYRFIQSANLKEEQMQLCRATVKEFKYKEMQQKVLSLFGDKVQGGIQQQKMKEEPVFYGNSTYNPNRGGYSNRNSQRVFTGRGRGGRVGQNPRGRGQYTTQSSPKQNPPGKYGTPSTCAFCGSKFHWIRDCPDKPTNYERKRSDQAINYCETNMNQTGDDDRDVQIELFQHSSSDEKMKLFVGETIGCAVIDSGCSKTVAGNKWVQCYMDQLDEKDLNKIEQCLSNQTFKFGQGDALASKGKIKLPAKVGSKSILIETDIVDADIPLLLSKEALKNAGTLLDFNNDQLTMFGEVQTLIATESGHYAIPLTAVHDDLRYDEQVILLAKSARNIPANPKAIAEKLHRQFCHCSDNRLIQLVQSSKLWDDHLQNEIIDNIKITTKNCNICKQFKRAPAVPVVSVPLSNNFNDVVAMDLIVMSQGTYIVHLIDLFTRYSMACVRKTKRQDCITDAIMKIWIKYFGSPRKFLADNGGEFANAGYTDMCESFNIEIMKTAAESPWSNGTCERHNAVIKMSVLKIMEDTKCSIDTAVAWAISAKNSLHGHHGYSPNTLVFGRNPNFPSVFTNKLPAMSAEEGSLTNIVQENLKAMKKARESFISAESSEKIKRALSHNVRTSLEKQYINGDKVYFKRKDIKKWHGPATVIGQDGKQILLRNGGELYRVHVSRITLVHQEETDKHVHFDIQDQEAQTDDEHSQRKQLPKNKNQIDGAERDDTDEEQFPAMIEIQHEENELAQSIPRTTINEANANDTIENTEEANENIGIDDEDEPLANIQHRIRKKGINPESSADTNDENRDVTLNHTNEENGRASINTTNAIHPSQVTVPPKSRGRPRKTNTENRDVPTTNQATVLPKLHSNILYKRDENDKWRHGYVHSRAGKATGKNSGCLNIQDDDTNDVQWYDFNHSKIIWEPVPAEIFITTNDKEAIHTAKLKELENWRKNNAYEEVPNTGQYVISTRWVMTTKEKGGSVTTKARLVARGFEDQEIDIQKLDSPTCSKETIRISLALTATEKWKCNSLDVKAAFLQGNPLTREIYIKPPKEAKTENVWKLHKAVYGLNEASRHWYDRVKDTLIGIGFNCCKYDEAFFIYRDAVNLQGFVSIHVDDFLPSGNGDFQGQTMQKVKEIFEIGTESSTPMKYLGVNLNQDEKYQINLDQNDYVSSMEATEIIEPKDKQRTLSREEQYAFRAIVGQLNWLSSQSRPDLAFDVCQLSTKLNSATIKDLIQANKIVKKAKNAELSLVFPNLQSPLHLLAYCDASYANLPDGSSQGGCIIFLTDDEENVAPICWWSRKLKRVCKSTETAETMVMLEAIDAVVWLSAILNDIYGKKMNTPIIRSDNMSLHKNIHSTTAVEEKRLRVELAAIRESARKTEFKAEWVTNQDQLADCLTKQGADSNKLLGVLRQGHL